MIDTVDGKLIADILASCGAFIGIYAKTYQLFDEDTVISRKSSLPNVVTYPVTAIAPFAYLQLYFLTATSIISWAVWVGIYLFRSPDDEDLFGRD